MIEQEYGAGRMLTGEVKKRLIEVLTEIVERHRRARGAVTDEVNKYLFVCAFIWVRRRHIYDNMRCGVGADG